MQGTPPQSVPAARSEQALSVLLQQLSELLIAASEDSSNTPGSSSTQGQNIASRMRSVLLMLVAQCTEQVSEAEFVAVLKLTNIAMKRLPRVFSEEGCSTAAELLRILVGVYTQLNVRSVQGPLEATVAALLNFLAVDNYQAFNLVLAGHAQLLLAAQELLHRNAWSALATARENLPTELLQQACSVADQQTEGHTEQTGQQAVTAAGLTATSSWSCQLAASIVLDVMTLAMQRHPAQTAMHTGAEYQDAVSWLLLHAGLSLQSAALQNMTVMLKTLPRLPLHALAGAVATSVATWTEFPPQDPSILQAWTTAVCACMAQLLESAAAAHQVPAVASGLAAALTSAIAAASWDAQLQTCLCSVLVSLARLWPLALANLPSLISMAASNQGLGLQLVRCLALLAEGSATAGALDIMHPLHGDGASQEQPGNQRPPAAHHSKKRRLQPSATSDKAGPQLSSSTDSLSEAVASMLASVGSLSPLVSSQASRDGHLRQLQCLLTGLGTASAAAIQGLGDTVQQWVAWSLSPAQMVFCTEEQVALVMGATAAYLGASLAHWAAPEASSKAHARPAQAHAQPGCVALSSEQIKALAALPWSPAEPASAADTPLHGTSIGCSARTSSLLLLVAAMLLELPDLGLPFSKGTPLARAADHADVSTRQACAALVPLACAAASRQAGKVYSTGIALLHKLAGDASEAVRGAVARSLQSMVHLRAVPVHERHACFGRACAAAQATLPSSLVVQWTEGVLHSAESSSSGQNAAGSSPQTGTVLPVKDVVSFCKQLLFSDNAKEAIQVPMVHAVGIWLSAAAPEELRSAKVTIRGMLQLLSSGGQETCDAVSSVAGALAAPSVLQAAYSHDSDDVDCSFMQELRGMIEAEADPGRKQSMLHAVLTAAGIVSGADALFLAQVMMTDCLGGADAAVRATAAMALEDLARIQKASMQSIVLEMPRFLEYVGGNLILKPQILGELAEVMDMDEQELGSRVVPCALPRLTRARDLQGLQALAKRAGLEVAAMVSEHSLRLLAQCIYEGGSDNFGPLMAFMEEILGEGFLNELDLRHPMAMLMLEVICHAAATREWGEGHSLPEPVLARTLQVLGELYENVADFLSGGAATVSILKKLGDQLERLPPLDKGQQHPTDMRKRIVILRSVVVLIHLLGPQLKSFLPLVMVLLTGSLGPEAAVGPKLQSLEGWSALVHVLAAEEPLELANIANQVVVAMLEPLNEGGQVSAAAAAVVQAVVETGRQHFKEQLPSLPPLPPSISALQHCNTILAEERGTMTAEEHIEGSLESLRHDSLAVRANALQDLRSYLHTHRSWLAGLLAGSASNAGHNGPCSNSRLLSRMLSGLLKCCDPEAHTSSSVKAQQVCAECLGLLGAVDPARVSVELAVIPSLLSSDADILRTLVSDHLVRLLRVAASRQHLDSATFAIQELLKYYAKPSLPSSATPVGSSSTQAGNELFEALSPDVQALVSPYLHSSYTLTRSSGVPRRVLFSTESGASFRRWLSTWLRQTIEHHTSGKWVRMFQACTLVVRGDIQTCLFLLPYVIQNAVGQGQDAARADITAEVTAVLTSGHTTREGELCVQAVFTLLDVLKAWLEQRKLASAPLTSSGNSRASAEREVQPSEEAAADARVSKLMAAIPKDLLAKAAHACGAHARALQYYELHVRESKGGRLNSMCGQPAVFADDEVSFLQEIYGMLEEPDGLAGLVRLRPGGPRLEDQVLAAEKAGHWGEALTLYEQSLRTESAAGASQLPSQETARLSAARKGHLKCLLQMGHMEAVLAQVDGWAQSSSGAVKSQLAAAGVAAAWRLGRWEALDSYLQQSHISPAPDVLDGEQKWDTRIGHILAAMHRRNSEGVKADLEDTRAAVMAPLSAASMESHARAYPHLVKLHMLGEAADCASLLQEGSLGLGPLERQRRLRWDERLAATHPSLTTQEPILALRRQLAALTGAAAEAGKCWLAHAKLCRGNGHFQAALTATLEALARDVPGAPIQRAKLLWDMNEPHRAIMQLQQVLQQLDVGHGGHTTQLSVEQRRSEAGMVLQLARWTAETGQGAKADIKALFAQAVSLHRPSEKVYFHYAQYLDQLMRDAKERQTAGKAGASAQKTDHLRGRSKVQLGEDEPFTDILKEVLHNYGSSVQHGIRHVYQSLPRLLTVWFDYGSHCLSKPSGACNKKERIVRSEVYTVMQGLSKSLPMYVWLVALSQLTSRICHPHEETKHLTQHILTRVIAAFPHQALWAMAAVSKSSMTARRMAASAIISSAGNHAAGNTDTQRLIKQFTVLCDQLIRLCHFAPSGRVKTMSAKSEFGPLLRMMPVDVMLPTTAGLTLALPASGCAEKDHNPFGAPVTMTGICDQMLVLSSLQKPKKMVIVGSDGKEYAYLAKPKDDLRKDQRMMEVAGVLNRLFAKEPASRRRNLYIRRFAVTPLTEDCGLIEWVSHTVPFREQLNALYAAEGLFDVRTSNMAIKSAWEKHTQVYKDKKRSELLDRILVNYPPRMHKWQLARFPEPAAWLSARMAFTRTAAVWSMVGHIVGLGDRHGENLLLDASTGDVVHVDFSCLFDKGLTLETPEVVPFRLTQNLVDGCGVCGIEGAFRRAAEVTLGVLRQHRPTLVSVLETFVHDPLVDWTKHDHRANTEVENPQAQEAITIVQGRLTGTLLGVKSIPSMPLSPEGQALRLIKEATDKDNLGSMYIWWQPWM